ncbi:MAG: glycoside hydrolase family 95 protein [Planctomycetes bacterium]|nr:glycoside hydrolase family 95 protein [Planctomycetota bacterium]
MRILPHISAWLFAGCTALLAFASCAQPSASQNAASESQISVQQTLNARHVSTDTTLWYQQPAAMDNYTQAMPLGNGRLGMMPFGGIEQERLLLNEDSLWAGWFEPGNDKEGSYAALEAIRAHIADDSPETGGAGRSDADTIGSLLRQFGSEHGYGKNDFGRYQSFGDVWLDTGHQPDKTENYRRDLDLQTGIASVSYVHEGTSFRRTYFSSHPAQVSVAHLSSDHQGAIDFTLRTSSLHENITINADGGSLVLVGQVDTGDDASPGMRFEGRYQLILDGGTIQATEVEGQAAYRVSGADSVTLLIAGATNYALNYPNYVGEDPSSRNQATLARLAGIPYAQLKAEHIADHQSLFQRIALYLGDGSRTDLPTDERLRAYKKARDDRGLESLLFQFGRYLLIASSREGGLPVNLQGLWCDSNKPAWNGDYHLNINLQMNYWPVDSCALSECIHPLLDWVHDLKKAGSRTAEIHYNSRGWVAHHTCNVWGFTSPGPFRGVHMYEADSAAFLAQNLWDHFAYTRDKAYLKEAWPVLEGAALFWLDNLQEVEGGKWLAVSPSYSPEQGPITDGAMYSTQIVYDLFTNCIEALSILQSDDALAADLRQARDRLQPLAIGEQGDLQEWRDAELPIQRRSNTNKHRHFSHLYALYPGRQILFDEADTLSAAAQKSMQYRGDGATGWSMGWKINAWARFLDGDHAHLLIGNLIAGRLADNLWGMHPPFQIDGNFGYTAGVAEMLVQSHSSAIHLLPALPSSWSDGSIQGVRARGGVALNLVWADGSLRSVELTSTSEQNIRLRYQDIERTLHLQAGKTIQLNSLLQ